MARIRNQLDSLADALFATRSSPGRPTSMMGFEENRTVRACTSTPRRRLPARAKRQSPPTGESLFDLCYRDPWGEVERGDVQIRFQSRLLKILWSSSKQIFLSKISLSLTIRAYLSLYSCKRCVRFWPVSGKASAIHDLYARLLCLPSPTWRLEGISVLSPTLIESGKPPLTCACT